MPSSTLYHTDVVMTWQEIVSKCTRKLLKYVVKFMAHNCRQFRWIARPLPWILVDQYC